MVPHAAIAQLATERADQPTTVSRATRSSVNSSSSSRLAVENSETTAPSGPCLEPVQRSRGDGVLHPGPQLDLMSDRVRPRWRRARRTRRGLAPDVEVDEPAAATERLLLARRGVERRVPVLWARLSRPQDELLRAVALGVDVYEELEPRLVEAESPKSATSIESRSSSVRTMPVSASRSVAYRCASCSSSLVITCA